MLVLGFDTATPWGTMALADGEEILFEVSLQAGKGSGEYLLALLQTLLKKIARKISDLDLLVVGIGPGSYTGIRVGLAAAKGLAEGLNLPVCGLSTLRIIAENGRLTTDWIAPVIDARRGNVYAALYHKNTNEMIEVEAPVLIPATEFALFLAKFPEVTICGDASKTNRATWLKYSNLKIAPSDWDRPTGSLMVRLGREESGLKKVTDLNQLIPCYLRKVEAEVRLEEKLNATQNRFNEDRRPGRSPGD